jgi:hypothetical protein
MIVVNIGPASPDEMVLAFLRAEIDSPRFSTPEGWLLRDQLRQSGLDPSSLADKADLTDPRANAKRAEILKWWTDPKHVFDGMPSNVSWRRDRLQPDEIGGLKYCQHPTWLGLSGTSRLVADGAANICKVVAPDNVNTHVARVADRVRRGEKFPELILVQALDGGLVILEGHTRATAYVVAPVHGPIEVLVGTSPRIGQWAFHG